MQQKALISATVLSVAALIGTMALRNGLLDALLCVPPIALDVLAWTRLRGLGEDATVSPDSLTTGRAAFIVNVFGAAIFCGVTASVALFSYRPNVPWELIGLPVSSIAVVCGALSPPQIRWQLVGGAAFVCAVWLAALAMSGM